jgi:phenylpropionate dioxygenase-like ring-hydroxylating dioxygenase large terminal subunit
MSIREVHRWAGLKPELGSDPIPIEPYVSREFYELERERIFRRVWLNVARVEEVPRPGDYVVRDLRVADTSLLIVRGEDGIVRAFHNMCSHRGNQVAWDARGNCRGAFVCQFHGWSFDTQGRLRHIVDEDRFFGVDRAANGLTAIATETWAGFVFVNLAPEPRESLAGYLATVAPKIDGYPFADLRFSYFYRVDDGVNWKLLQEAQQEGWHVPVLHRRTLARSAANKGELFRHAACLCLGRHGMVSSHAPRQFEPTPLGAVSFRHGAGTFDAFAVEDDGGAAGMKWHGAFDLYHVFPNFFIGLLRGSYFTYHIWPLAVDRSLWEIRVYCPPARTAGQLFSQEFGKCGIRDTLREDVYTHERIQAVVGSGAKRVFHLQDEETVLRNFNKAVMDYVGGAYG